MISWVKRNKFASVLILTLLFLLTRNYFSTSYLKRSSVLDQAGVGFAEPGASISSKSSAILPQPDYAPTTNVENRIVIGESSLSLLVSNVSESQKRVIAEAESLGGYMVNSYLSHPEEKESTYGSVTIRVPQEKVTNALDHFRNLSVKVVSESLSGQDVTDEYIDNEARIATLQKTKDKFEFILDRAVTVSDILSVQRELISLQDQMDGIKGRQQYLEKSAQMTRITVYLSTDELSLPYAPSEAWRPNVIFKKAVRSLVSSVRTVGTWIIWILVYSVVWLPILLVCLFVRKRLNRGS